MGIWVEIGYGKERSMNKLMILAVCAGMYIAGLALADVNVPEGFQADALNQDFGGGLDWLPDGDIIGLYADQNMIENSYVGIIDANGDGIPASVTKIHDFGEAIFGTFVKVSPDGSFALLGDSLNYKVFAISLPDYNVTEVVPSSGSFDGVFDLAFIDNENCYLSVNPAWGTTNKILHLDLGSCKVTEVASIDDTFSGPVDVDDGGNLYYVKNSANYPVQPGDFALLSFAVDKLENALSEGAVLGVGDADEIAPDLDGGYDVAWHASGAVYVSDANNGKIYKIASVSEFATLGADMGGGFTYLALRDRDQAFDAGVLTDAALCAGYMDVHDGPTPPNVYRITSSAPEIGVALDKVSYVPGDSLSVEVSIQRAIPIAFDVYVVFRSSGGLLRSCKGASLVKGIEPYIEAVPRLTKPYEKVIKTLTVPVKMPKGEWTVYMAILRAGDKASVRNALAIDSAVFTVE
jgi:hypothetical protein